MVDGHPGGRDRLVCWSARCAGSGRWAGERAGLRAGKPVYTREGVMVIVGVLARRGQWLCEMSRGILSNGYSVIRSLGSVWRGFVQGATDHSSLTSSVYRIEWHITVIESADLKINTKMLKFVLAETQCLKVRIIN